MATELNVYEKIQQHLYEDTETALQYLTPTEIEIKKRVMVCVAKIMDEPMIQDKDMVRFIMNGCGGNTAPVGQSLAYRDIAAIRKILGNIQLASKSWYRYIIVEGAKEGFDIARAEKDAKGMASCLDKIGKYTRADREDDPFDFSQLIPPSFEPTNDVTVMDGFEKIDNLEEERRKFRELFTKDLKKRAEDVNGE